MKIVDAKTMRSLDREAIKDYAIPGRELMENAGAGVAGVARKMLANRPGARVSIIAGKGNNGGDGFVAARHLSNAGFKVRVFSTFAVGEFKGDAGVNARAWEKMDGETSVIRRAADIKKHSSFLKHSALIVDALLGTGLKSEARGVAASLIDLMNSLHGAHLSVDVPSGIDATTGAILGNAVRADVTATMALPKLGLYLFPGREMAGRVEIVSIGMPARLLKKREIRWELTDDASVEAVLEPRRGDSHKGTFGHLAVVAGTTGKTGAAYMVAMGAMRTGVGLVTIGLPESLNPVMEVKATEAMTFPLEEGEGATLAPASIDGLKELLKGKAAMVLGPGIGQGSDVEGFIRALFSLKGLPPTVVDADALNALKGRPGMLKKVSAPLVLTPHPGEMARLLKAETAGVQADRIGSARKLAERTGAVVVFKGAPTLIAAPGPGKRGGGIVALNPTGGPALATAGTGDVLAGMVGALLARGLKPFDAAKSAVYLHGLAADRFVEGLGGSHYVGGMIATDLLPLLPGLVNSFSLGKSERTY